ncbi:hypothetical protein [Alteromonas abrolhosensis]|uniref:hypothetical protein n=1 Tax=Alteromonas abrolhosensis TaxID=1892904 RepID=UPI003BAAE382
MLSEKEKLEQEILKLKGETTKPEIKPSEMDKGGSTDENENKKPRKRCVFGAFLCPVTAAHIA